MNLQTKLDEMRKRCEAATPGPWEYLKPSDIGGQAIVLMNGPAIVPNGWGLLGDDGRFIAAARSDLPLLISALEVCLGALHAHHTEWGTNENCNAECSATCRAIAKAEALLVGEEE